MLNAIDDLMSTVTDAETGQRGYLLTQRETYLEPYQFALQQVDENLAALKTLLAENAGQLQRLAELEPLIAAKLEELHRAIDLMSPATAKLPWLW